MADETESKKPDAAEILDLIGRLKLDGVALGDEPSWQARIAQIAAQLPDAMMTDIVARMRHSLGDQMVDFEHFASMYRLTPAETELVRSLAAGHSVPEHARRMGISGNTARVHMQRVLEKTGARRQTDLLRKLLE